LLNGGHRAGRDYLEEGRHPSKSANPTIEYLRACYLHALHELKRLLRSGNVSCQE